MDVDPADEEEFHRWYNQQHIPERLEIPGYVSARRFQLESGDDGMLKFMCLWEMEDSVTRPAVRHAQTEKHTEEARK